MGWGASNGFLGCSVPAIPSCFFTTFLKDCGRGESLWATTYLNTVFGGKQGHALCRILSLQQGFFVLVQFHVDHRNIIKLR